MFAKKENVLITGGAGFIGKHLTNALLHKNCTIAIVDRSIGYSGDGVSYHCMDIAEYLNDINNIADVDIIFHLAGNSHPLPSVNNPLMDFNLNLQLSVCLIEAIRKSGNKIRLINVSSAAIYGNPERLPIVETDKPAPLTPYGVSKLAVENYVNVYTKLFNLEGISVRPFSVYGIGLYKQVVFDLVKKLQANPDRLEVYGDGSQLRDFIYIDDLVDALLIVAEKGQPGEVYNIASGKSHSINEVVQCICTEMRIQPEIVYSGTVRSGEPEKWIVDISKIKELGFSSKTSLKSGIHNIVEWFRLVK